MSMNVSSRKIIKRWFTLIEILIVIAIISLLLTTVMQFSWSQIWNLRQKKEIEEFKDAFNTIITKNINSNYINKEKYTHLEINITNESKNIFLKYENKDHLINTGNVQIPFVLESFNNLKINNKEEENINISLSPYIIGCTINETKDDAYFEILSSKRSCFTIDHSTCQLKEKKCED